MNSGNISGLMVWRKSTQHVTSPPYVTGFKTSYKKLRDADKNKIIVLTVAAAASGVRRPRSGQRPVSAPEVQRVIACVVASARFTQQRNRDD